MRVVGWLVSILAVSLAAGLGLWFTIPVPENLEGPWLLGMFIVAIASLSSGMAPLGYDTKARRITVNEPEAETVRTVFRSYLKLGSLNLLMADLRERGIVTKVRTLKTGKTVGGVQPSGQLASNSSARRRVAGRLILRLRVGTSDHLWRRAIHIRLLCARS
jgi:hypothetical protein